LRKIVVKQFGIGDGTRQIVVQDGPGDGAVESIIRRGGGRGLEQTGKRKPDRELKITHFDSG
jgi:hypothetical protein